VEDLDIVVDFREYHKGKSQNQSQQMTNLWPNIIHWHFCTPTLKHIIYRQYGLCLCLLQPQCWTEHKTEENCKQLRVIRSSKNFIWNFTEYYITDKCIQCVTRFGSLLI
jgi:hypothetical protein